MANLSVTYEHASASLLSQVKLPGSDTVYYLKDADLRAIVEALGDAAAKEMLVGTIADNTTSGDLATAAQIVTYVEAKVAGLAGAMHFKAGNRAAQTAPEAGDVVIEGTTEYVYDGEAWQELGDEAQWVKKTRKITDNLDLQSDITTEALKNALGLKAMSQVDKGEVTITPKGSVSVALKDADTATDAVIAASADYTPAGTIATEDATGTNVNYTPDGSVQVTPTTATFSAGTMTAINGTPSTQFSVNGVTASVSGETLTFADTTKSVALVASDISVGTVPSLKNGTEDATSVLTGVTGSFTGKGTKISFTGTTETGLKPTKITYIKQVVDNENTSFSGTQETLDVTPKSAT